MTFALLVMTLNEVEGMKAIMPKIRREWLDEIFVVDGGSTDGTVEWARENGYNVYIQKQKGFRHAYVEVMPQVKSDVLITFSPDGNSIPELIPELIEKMKEGYDMVIVSRYLGQAKSDDDDFLTSFGNWFFTKTANLLHGGNYTDAMVIYRAYRKSLIKELELDEDRWYSTPEKLFSCKVSWEPLLSVRATRRKLKVSEIPGDEPPRIGGERKLRVWAWGATFLYQFVRDFLIWR